MEGRIRKSRHLIGTNPWPWVIVVVLAALVSTFEAAGAILLFMLLGLMARAEGALELPVVGDIGPLVADVAETSLYLGAAVVVAVFFVIRGVVTVAQTYAQVRVTENAGARLAATLHSGYLSIPYSARGQQHTSEQIRNAHDTVQRFVSGLFLPIVMILSEAVLVVALTTVLVIAAPMATVLVIVVVGPVVLLLNRAVHPMLERLGRDMQSLSTASLQTLRDSLEGIDEIRVLGRERFFTRRFATIRKRLARTKYLKETLERLPAIGLETALVLFVAAFLAVTVLAGEDVLHVLPVLGLFGYIGLRLLPSLERLVVYVNALRFAGPAIDDIHADIRRVEPWLSRFDEDVEPLGLREAITLDAVSLRYPDTAVDALHAVDLRITRGQFVGIVGPTGGGKSTLLDLVVGLRRPDSGAVRVDGVDIHERLASWFRTIGIVPQTVFLVNDSLRRNIALGVEDDEIDEARIESVVRIAQLDGLAASLPHGLDTHVGESGTRLSGGQRQRVAIARAMYHDPQVLLFDEGTSALDTVTESALMAALDHIRGQRTVIAVAHRLASIRDAEVIHLVDDGRITASGTYRELLESNATFRELARTHEGG